MDAWVFEIPNWLQRTPFPLSIRRLLNLRTSRLFPYSTCFEIHSLSNRSSPQVLSNSPILVESLRFVCVRLRPIADRPRFEIPTLGSCILISNAVQLHTFMILMNARCLSRRNSSKLKGNLSSEKTRFACLTGKSELSYELTDGSTLERLPKRRTNILQVCFKSPDVEISILQDTKTNIVGVDFEEAGEKWRAGDAQKSARFFLRALDDYNAGLRHFPRSFDLAYNK